MCTRRLFAASCLCPAAQYLQDPERGFATRKRLSLQGPFPVCFRVEVGKIRFRCALTIWQARAFLTMFFFRHSRAVLSRETIRSISFYMVPRQFFCLLFSLLSNWKNFRKFPQQPISILEKLILMNLVKCVPIFISFTLILS